MASTKEIKQADTKSPSSFYTIKMDNWYQKLPYSFVFYDKDGGPQKEFFLPINPSNINIVTHFATNIISTAYGVVEEHSEQRFFDITIAGTTGMSVQYRNLDIKQDSKNSGKVAASKIAKKNAVSSALNKVSSLLSGTPAHASTSHYTKTGRRSFPVTIAPLGGFARRTMELVKNTLNKASDAISSVIGGGGKGPPTGLDSQDTGYYAFHKLYLFLLEYKKDVTKVDNNSPREGTGNRHPLRFRNYKDNNEYNIAIQTFQLTRSSEDPMLYNYTITMRAYGLTNVGQIKYWQMHDAADRLKDLGLDGIAGSKFSAMGNAAKNAKNAISSAVTAVKGAGS